MSVCILQVRPVLHDALVGDILPVSAHTPLTSCCSDLLQCHGGKELRVPSEKASALSSSGLPSVCNWVIFKMKQHNQEECLSVGGGGAELEETAHTHRGAALKRLFEDAKSAVEVCQPNTPLFVGTHFLTQRSCRLITAAHQATIKAALFNFSLQGFCVVTRPVQPTSLTRSSWRQKL